MLKTQVVNHGIRGTGSCGAHTIANFLDVPFDEAEALLTAHTDYHPRKGVSVGQFHDLMLSLGMTYVTKGVRLTGKDAASKLPPNAILHFGKHVAALREGVLLDAFPTTRMAGCKQIKGWWE